MTVSMKPGKGEVPIWAAITVVVSILLAVGGISVGAVSKASDADHRTMMVSIAQATESGKDREVRLRSIEQDVSVLQAQYATLLAGQEKILDILETMRQKYQ